MRGGEEMTDKLSKGWPLALTGIRINTQDSMFRRVMEHDDGSEGASWIRMHQRVLVCDSNCTP